MKQNFCFFFIFCLPLSSLLRLFSLLCFTSLLVLFHLFSFLPPRLWNQLESRNNKKKRNGEDKMQAKNNNTRTKYERQKTIYIEKKKQKKKYDEKGGGFKWKCSAGSKRARDCCEKSRNGDWRAKGNRKISWRIITNRMRNS